jgi:hypothetical protein
MGTLEFTGPYSILATGNADLQAQILETLGVPRSPAASSSA